MFSDNVYDVFSDLILHHGFLRAFPTDDRYASLIKKIDDKCCAYILVKDGRPGGANLVVSLWIAPPNSADDSLQTLNVGYELIIASSYEIDDDFFHWAKSRIIATFPLFPGFSEIVQQEMANPLNISKRWTVYQHERNVLSVVREMAFDQSDQTCLHAIQIAKAKGIGCLPTSSEWKVFEDVASIILSKKLLKDEPSKFYDNSVQRLKGTIFLLLSNEALIKNI